MGILRSYGHKFLSDLSEKQINIDGKKLRGASDKGRKNQGIYLVSAWVSENQLCFGQSKARAVLPFEMIEKWKGLSTLVKIDSKRNGKEETSARPN